MAQMIITEHIIIMIIIIYRLPPLHRFPPTLWTQMFKINLTCTSASVGALWEVWGEGSVSSDSPVGDPGLVHTSFHPLHDEIQQDFHGLAHVIPVCSTRLKIRDSARKHFFSYKTGIKDSSYSVAQTFVVVGVQLKSCDSAHKKQ